MALADQGERTGSTCHVSPSAEKEVLKEGTEHSGLQEQLAQLQSENLSLCQQLEEMQTQQLIRKSIVNVAQDWVNNISKNFSADTQKKVNLLEERNKEINAEYNDLREQFLKYEADKVEREGTIRQLQQELADALRKLAVAEASLEVNMYHCKNLEETKLGLQKELEEVKTKCQQLEKRRLQSEGCVHDLKIALETEERDQRVSHQRLQLLLPSSENTDMKQLEERVQCVRLEATAQQQSSRIEALQRDLQGYAQEQAASRDTLGQIKNSDPDTQRKQLKHRIRDPECDLNIKITPQASTAGTEKYEKLHLEETVRGRCLEDKLERAAEKLPEAKTLLLVNPRRRQPSVIRSFHSGGLAANPVWSSVELGQSCNTLSRQSRPGESFLSASMNAYLSRKRLADFLTWANQKLTKKISEEIENGKVS
ncbi:ankyrin repeat domain-containing protein 26-like [Calypte anna]|uniref:ankyrin repeat domain-containing protein 26-like n=1 Tax=Calypte anna TaxID=9244 RepID=UPI0011C42345|nr:ankyrin repeat domain-containing protein 26-like [Calypte anna]